MGEGRREPLMRETNLRRSGSLGSRLILLSDFLTEIFEIAFVILLAKVRFHQRNEHRTRQDHVITEHDSAVRLCFFHG